MTNTWKQWDFAGAGLQTVNLELTKRLRKRPLAYGLWVLFPLGLHAFYLRERGLGLLYLAGSTVFGASAALAPWPYATGLGAIMAVAALVDAATLERRLTAYNKALRVALLLSPKATPPPGYRGRYTDGDRDISEYLAIKDQEQAGHSLKTQPSLDKKRGKSFQEQEAALREYAEHQKRAKNPRS